MMTQCHIYYSDSIKWFTSFTFNDFLTGILEYGGFNVWRVSLYRAPWRMRRGLRCDTQQDVLRLNVCVNDLAVSVKILQTFKHLRQIQFFWSCADFCGLVGLHYILHTNQKFLTWVMTCLTQLRERPGLPKHTCQQRKSGPSSSNTRQIST